MRMMTSGGVPTMGKIILKRGSILHDIDLVDVEIVVPLDANHPDTQVTDCRLSFTVPDLSVPITYLGE